MTATQSKIQRSKAAAPAAAGGLSSVPIRRSGGGAALSDYLFSHYRVSDPSDQSEVQAERAADKVMSGGQVHASEAAPGGAEIARSPEGGDAPAGGGTGGSTGLPGPVQERMEGAFGRSFEGVRVHHDQRADSLSRGFHADAFTQGSDIYFRKGSYDPATRQGQHLIAHELAHVDEGTGGILRHKREEILLAVEIDDEFKSFFNAVLGHKECVGKAIWAEEPVQEGSHLSVVDGITEVGRVLTYGGTTYSKGAEIALPGDDNKTKRDEQKRNANYLTGIGQLASVVTHGINGWKGYSGGAKASEELKELQTKKRGKQDDSRHKIDLIVAEIKNAGILSENEKKKLEEIATRPEEKDSRAKLSGFMEEYKRKHKPIDGEASQECLNQLIRLRFMIQSMDVSDATKSLKYISSSNEKSNKYSDMWKSGLNILGSGAAAANSFWAAISGDSGNGGRYLSMVGGLMSTVGGIWGSVGNIGKAKRATEKEKRVREAREFAMKTLTGLSQTLGLVDDVYDLNDYRNLSDADPSEKAKIEACDSIYGRYVKLKSTGVVIDEFVDALINNEPTKVRTSIIQNYSG